MSTTLVCAHELSCRRGARNLWSGLDISVHAGDALHISGANGIGKSSLLRIIADLLPPESGRVECNGTLALLDENPALDRDKSLVDALTFWAKIDGRTSVSSALDAVGMAALADVPVRYFSTGQRKRAAMARLLIQEAPIWLLDEPMNGLDSDGMDRLNALIALHIDAGGCAIIASHQPLALANMRSINLGDYQR